MQIKSWDGYSFSTGNYYGGINWDDARGQWRVNPLITPRVGVTAALTGAQISERIIPVEFVYTGSGDVRSAIETLLSKLDPMNTTPRTLVATRYDGTDVQCEAIVITPGEPTLDANGQVINILRVSFLTADPIWRKTAVTYSPSSSTVETINASPDTMTVTNGGYTTAYPVILITPTVQRGSDTATVGWKKRQTMAITNNTARNWYRELVVIDLGDSAALVTAGDAQADGDDFRVRCEGIEYPRQLINWNTKQTYVAVPVTIPAGDTLTLELVYKNSSATAPTDLDAFTTFDGNYCAIDLGGSSGTATSGSASTVVDSGKSWTVDRWAGGFVRITGGTGSGQTRRIASNTATTVYVTRAFTTNPDNTSTYCIHMSGWAIDGGQASSGAAGSLTDSSQCWSDNMWKSGTVTIVSGTGNGQTRTISSNTRTVLTVSSNWGTNPDSTSVYRVTAYGAHTYYVDQVNHSEAHRGGWQQSNRYTRPGKIWFGDKLIGGWKLDTFLPNNDDYNQSRTLPANVGGSLTHYFPVLDADRRKSSDSRLQEEGQADGVSIHDPRGFKCVFWDYQYKNPNSASGATNGICKFVVAVKEEGGEEWGIVAEDGTTRSALQTVADGTATAGAAGTLTDSGKSWKTDYWAGGTIEITGGTGIGQTRRVSSNTATVITVTNNFTVTPDATSVYHLTAYSDLTTYGTPIHVYMGQVPYDEVEVSKDASASDTATIRWYEALQLWLDPSAITFGTLSSAADVYDLNLTISRSYGSAGASNKIVFGGPNHYIHLEVGADTIAVDCATGEITLYDGTVPNPMTFVKFIPWAAVAYKTEADTDFDGTLENQVAREWMPLAIGANTLTFTESAIGTLEAWVQHRDGYFLS